MPDPPVSSGSARTSRLLFGVKVAIAVLVAWFLVRAVPEARDQLARARFSADQLSWRWLLLAAACYAAGMVPMGLFWWRVLRQFGQPVRWWHTFYAYATGQLGKYVPGKALVVVMRAGLLHTQGVHPVIGSISVFVETLTMMAVGACLALAVLAAFFTEHRRWIAVSAVLIVVSGLPTVPAVTRWIVRQLRMARVDPLVQDALDRLNERVMLLGWALCALGWLLFAASLGAVFQAIGVDSATWLNYPQAFRLLATVCLAVVAGFLSMLPGGLGVRELVFYQLLSGLVGQAAALISAIILRLVWLVSEVLVSIILYGISRIRPSSP